MNANSRGSQCLAGAASMKHRMPALVGPASIWEYSSVGRAATCKVAGGRFDSCYSNHRLNNGSLPTN